MTILYRGIAVDSDLLNQVVEEIRSTGLQAVEAREWRNEIADPKLVRDSTSELESNPLSIRDTISALPCKPSVFACGDRFGGSYYALSHNRGATQLCSILVEFEAPIEALSVDGKDFLYTTFQLWDKNGKSHREKVRNILAKLFGRQILHYFDNASACSEIMARIGLCDLACYDLEVISAHIQNHVLIQGRYNTRFCSSFELQLPVPAHAIRSIDPAPMMPARPSEVTSLEEVFE